MIERINRVRLLMVLLMLPGAAAAGDPEADVMAVLDEFMTAFNRVDVSAWEATFHFPHYRLASGTMTVLEAPGTRTGEQLRTALASIGWARSQWDHRRIVHLGRDKAHVDTQFSRWRADGSLIGRYESLYILTRENGTWGVKMRSSFAQ